MNQIFVVFTCLAIVVVSASESSKAESGEERLIGAIVTSTTTLARLRSTTVTQPITCLLGAPATAPCTGRRKRRHAARRETPKTDLLSSGVAAEAAKLDSSMGDSTSLRQGKILLFATRLVTSTTDFTTTFTSTDMSTTVSVSVLCTANFAFADSFRLC